MRPRTVDVPEVMRRAKQLDKAHTDEERERWERMFVRPRQTRARRERIRS